jgi:hypothetical protein
MMRGLGLGVLGTSHVGHACDGARRGARGWCKSRGLEVVGCDIRREGKSRGRQGGEPGARGRIVTLAPNVESTAFVSKDPAPNACTHDGLWPRIGHALVTMLTVPAATAMTVYKLGKMRSGAARRCVLFMMISHSMGTECSAET